MKAILELHILQNFAPSNLNRDDTGSPKDAIFGGARRARISSQCLKRAIRSYVRDHELLPRGNFAVRTKRLFDELGRRLESEGRPFEQAVGVAKAALAGLKLKASEDKTQYLVFLGEGEIASIAAVLHEHWEALTPLVQVEGEKAKGKSSKDQKKDASGAVPDEVKKALGRAVRERGQGGDAVDLALFGRMLADLPERNQDAACQVAHALSTHRVDREYDFYTAVDDLKPDDNAGADMLGTMEFNSACFYRYLNIDLALLRVNLQKDDELVRKGLDAFLRGAVCAIPTGKQNSYAAHNPPSFIAVRIRQGGAPCNLANAFEEPASLYRSGSLVKSSVEKLSKHWETLDQFYGLQGKSLVWNGTGEKFVHGETCAALDELVEKSVAAAAQALGI